MGFLLVCGLAGS